MCVFKLCNQVAPSLTINGFFGAAYRAAAARGQAHRFGALAEKATSETKQSITERSDVWQEQTSS